MRTLLAAAAAAVARGAALDDELVAATIIPLNGPAWTSSNGEISVRASVPGDLVSDLQFAGVISDPWLDLTWLDNATMWDQYTWTFSRAFNVPAGLMTTAADVFLVVEGVKMTANATLNGVALGSITNQ